MGDATEHNEGLSETKPISHQLHWPRVFGVQTFLVFFFFWVSKMFSNFPVFVAAIVAVAVAAVAGVAVVVVVVVLCGLYKHKYL